MEKIFVSLVLLLMVSACVQKSPIAAPEVEAEPLPPLGSNITEKSRDALRPIPKPAPPTKFQTTKIMKLPAGQKPDLTVSKELPPKINGVPQVTYTKVVIIDDGEIASTASADAEKSSDIVVSKPKVDGENEHKNFKTLRGIKDGLAENTESLRGKIAKFLFPEFDDPEPIKGKKQAEAFCYGSLSDSTCYSKPIPGQEFRRVGG